jgi:hypothetical protein
MAPTNMPHHTKRFSRWGVMAAALISVLFPSSTSGIIHPQSVLWMCAATILMLAMTMRTHMRIQRWQGVNALGALVILALFLVFTMLSPFPYIAWGGLLPYLLLLTVLLTDVKRVNYGYGLIVTLFIINVILLILGFGTVLGNDLILNIMASYYQAYDPELYESMIVWSSKPVTVFASHSTAAFAYFALLCLNLRVANSALWVPMVRKLYLIAGIGYLCMIPFLMSNTALFLFLAAIPVTGSYFLHEMPPHYRKLSLIMLVCILFGITLLVIENLDVVEMISTVLSTEGSGFLSRYTSGGRLQGSYDFLINNYFQPIGLTYSSVISLGDNFITEYILKISIIGYGLILFMLFVWLRRNVFDQRSRIIFLLFFLLADLGYPLLPYPRAIGFLPLFVMIWNSTQPSRRVSHV